MAHVGFIATVTTLLSCGSVDAIDSLFLSVNTLFPITKYGLKCPAVASCIMIFQGMKFFLTTISILHVLVNRQCFL